MLKMNIKNLAKTIIPYAVFAVTLGVIGYLAWLNHNDFEKIIIKQVQTQLLITSLSEAQSIEKYVESAPVSAAGINALVKHINDLEKAYVFIIDDNAKIIDYPNASYVGKNILELVKGKISEPEQSKLGAVMQRIRSKEKGTAILDFLSEDINPRFTKTLIAFSPLRIGNNSCSIVVAMEYNVIENTIHKNARDNLIFMGFTCLVFIIFALIFYRARREKDLLMIRETVSNIINKQLRSEIEDRKRL